MKSQLVLTVFAALLLTGPFLSPFNVSSQGTSETRSATFAEIDERRGPDGGLAHSRGGARIEIGLRRSSPHPSPHRLATNVKR